MERMTLNEIKASQIGILNAIDKFCRDNDLHYFLHYGTLLGAIRHGGYIPWDDDIDIGMVREDYDTFIDSFNDYCSMYQVHSIKNDRDFRFAYSKVFDTTTVLHYPHKHGSDLAVNVDIFPVDNAPNWSLIRKMVWRTKDILGIMDVYRNDDVEVNGLKTWILKNVFACFPSDFFLRCIDNLGANGSIKTQKLCVISLSTVISAFQSNVSRN